MKLALDHHYSPSIAVELRERGHDVVAVIDRGWETEDDESLLVLCHEERRPLLTNNVGDLATILRRWAAEGRDHSGVIFTSGTSMPRHRQTIGRYIEVLERLLRASPQADAFADRLHWL